GEPKEAGAATPAAPATPPAQAAPAGGGAPLTADELENGVGPVKELTIGTGIDHELAERGEQIFNTKCMACHRLDEKYVGPALREVTARRTPRYVMNMMLNPQEMTARHPVARELLATHMTQMPAQNLTQEDARALLEYLRKVAREKPGAAHGAPDKAH
ncbi:MAG: cytochrome c, partial [Gemmatimonadetes bacterium]|nr:cytochrome c [Gemmatimonadota bacterium]